MAHSRNDTGVTQPVLSGSETSSGTAQVLVSPRVMGRAALAGTVLLEACGGGSTAAESPTLFSSISLHRAEPGTTLAMTEVSAARFLAQASMGANRAQIAAVIAMGYSGWIDAQFVLPQSTARWDWLVAKNFDAAINQNTENGFDASAWRKLLTAPDTLRQRITQALSEITVVAIDGLVGSGWRAFSAAAYLDLVEANAFGNYRTLLGQLSTSAPMGQFLTFRGNVKYNPITGALPDENYARELMQLFSIGLVKLNSDGTARLVNGQPQDTYQLDDITGLARVFTGWDFDFAGTTAATPAFLRRPMQMIAGRHETAASSFLGTTIAAGVSGVDSLKRALDVIFAHPNVAPFISRQLIQKLITSNPSPDYVARVATVFRDDGLGVAGNLQAVIKTLLLDTEARQPDPALAASYGKLREPILRFAGWARAFNVGSVNDAWNVGNTSDPGTALGQSPGRAPSVFNFFRPGYVPPNSPIGKALLVAPEFQITNESSVVGYVNYMQRAVALGVGDVKPDYSTLMPLADNAAALLAEINVVLAAGQIGPDNLAMLVSAVNGMVRGTDVARLNRIHAAVTLVLAAPEFLVQK